MRRVRSRALAILAALHLGHSPTRGDQRRVKRGYLRGETVPQSLFVRVNNRKRVLAGRDLDKALAAVRRRKALKTLVTADTIPVNRLAVRRAWRDVVRGALGR